MPLLIATNAGTLPVPASASPIEEFELFQLYETLAGVPVKNVAGIRSPSFKIVSALTVTVGIAFTVIATVVGTAHSPASGVNV